jgi:hypothetical protein
MVSSGGASVPRTFSPRKVSPRKDSPRKDSPRKDSPRKVVTSARSVVRVLDLCAGTKSIRDAAVRAFGAKGLRYVSVDSVAEFAPDHLVDVRRWDYRAAYRPGDFDIVWASPPCTEYSRAKTTGVRDLRLADSIVRRCLRIIDYLRHAVWFLENPATGFLPKRPFMRALDPLCNVCCYCRYGAPYKKPTCIWSNVPLALKVCSVATPCGHKRLTGSHPSKSQTGSRRYARVDVHPKGTRTVRSYGIPQPLMRILFGAAGEQMRLPTTTGRT